MDEDSDALPEDQERALRNLRQTAQFFAHKSGHAIDELYIFAALDCLASFIGTEKLISAYGPVPPDASRAVHLKLLADRLELAGQLFKRADPENSQGSLWAASDEIRALANGDIPQLFERLPVVPNSSRRRATYRLAEYQMRALAWAEFFKARGDKPGLYQERIKAAFNYLTWDAIRKWKPLIIEELGQEQYEAMMEIAWYEGKRNPPVDEDDINSRLKRDGKSYERLRRLDEVRDT